MLTPVGITTAEYIEALKAGNQTHARITFEDQNIVFTDEDITTDGIMLSSYLNGEEDLTFGRAVMSEINISLFRSSKTENLQWMDEFTLEFGVDIDATTYWVTVGYFIGERPERSITQNVIRFTAHDRMKKFDIEADEYLSSIAYSSQNPVSLSTIYSGLCTYCGVTSTAGDELANIMSRTFAESPFPDNGMTCRDVLAQIAEACGCYAKITADGNCKMVWYDDHMQDYSINRDDQFDIYVMEIDLLTNQSLKKTWADLEDFTWEELENYLWAELEGEEHPFKVSALRVKMMEDDVGVTIPAAADRNVYLIVDNQLLATANDTEKTNYLIPLYNRLSQFGAYIPSSVNCVGNWLIEAGDILSLEVGERNFIRFPVFSRVLKWNGTCNDTYEATGNLNREVISPSNYQRMTTRGRYHIFRNDIEQLYSEINDPTTGLSTKIDQTNQALSLLAEKVNAIYRMPTDPANDPSITLTDGDIWIDTSYVHLAEASDYDPTATYSIGDYCIYSDKVFTCNTDITTAEAWDPTHWDEDEHKNQWYQYDLTNTTWIEVDDNTKYAVQSGIEITADGVEIFGNKYIKMNSTGYIRANEWTFDNRGLQHQKTGETEIFQIAHIDSMGTNTPPGIFYDIDTNGVGIIQITARSESNGGCIWLLEKKNDANLGSFRPKDLMGKIGEPSHFVEYLYGHNYYGNTTVPGNEKKINFIPDSDSSYGVCIERNTTDSRTTIRPYSSSYPIEIQTARIYGTNNAIYLFPNTGATYDDYGMTIVNVTFQSRVYVSSYDTRYPLYITGYINNLSSREYKKNIQKLEETGDIIDKLEPVSFEYKQEASGGKRFGLIYEDAIKVIPEICDDIAGTKAIEYTQLIPILLKEIQNLRARVKALEELN